MHEGADMPATFKMAQQVKPGFLRGQLLGLFGFPGFCVLFLPVRTARDATVHSLAARQSTSTHSCIHSLVHCRVSAW